MYTVMSMKSQVHENVQNMIFQLTPNPEKNNDKTFRKTWRALILAILALHYPFGGKIEFYEKTRLYQLLDFTIIYLPSCKKNRKKTKNVLLRKQKLLCIITQKN